MLKTVQQQKTVDVTDDVICNMCGRSCRIADTDPRIKIFSHGTLDVTWGYSSNIGLQAHRLDFCEGCYNKIVKKCKVKPTIQQVAVIM